MPKKSDRKEHESAMSSLLPEVSLDDDPQDEEAGKENSSTELQNSSTTETKNYDSDSGRETSEEMQSQGPPIELNELSPLPNDRPDLQQKLGPYVSNDVDEALEDVYLLLRRRFGGGASKSLIVEAALRLVLSDYLQRGNESEVAKWMARLLQEESS